MTTAPPQQAASGASRRPRAWVRMNRPGSSSASIVEVAFTPPMHSTTDAGTGGGPDHPVPRRHGRHQRQHRPRGEHPGQHRGRGRPDHDGERRPQREHQPGQVAGGRRPDAERARQLDQAGEADRDEQRQPQPLGEPDRHVRELAGQVERRHRDGVADGLVVQRAQGVLRIPQVPQARVVGVRVQVDAELGVEDHPARVVRQQDGERAQPDQGGPAQHRAPRARRRRGPSVSALRPASRADAAALATRSSSARVVIRCAS